MHAFLCHKLQYMSYLYQGLRLHRISKNSYCHLCTIWAQNYNFFCIYANFYVFLLHFYASDGVYSFADADEQLAVLDKFLRVDIRFLILNAGGFARCDTDTFALVVVGREREFFS